MKCSECGKEKPVEELRVVGSAHINRGNKPHLWVQLVSCLECDAERKRLNDLGVEIYGEEIRQVRVHEFQMNLREFAVHTIGPDLVRMSRIEMGKVEATAEEKKAIGDAIEILRQLRKLDPPR